MDRFVQRKPRKRAAAAEDVDGQPPSKRVATEEVVAKVAEPVKAESDVKERVALAREAVEAAEAAVVAAQAVLVSARRDLQAALAAQRAEEAVKEVEEEETKASSAPAPITAAPVVAAAVTAEKEAGKDTDAEEESKADAVTQPLSPPGSPPAGVDGSDSSDDDGGGVTVVNDEIPLSNTAAWKEELQKHFLVPFPDEFFALWRVARRLNSAAPRQAFFDSLGIVLCGPFDVLARAFKGRAPQPLFLHDRCTFDPPELLTVMKRPAAGQHWGYYRDKPTELPLFVASGSAADRGKFSICGDHLFATVAFLLKRAAKSAEHEAAAAAPLRELKEEAKRLSITLEARKRARARKKDQVAATWSGLGIKVRITHGDVGYRDCGYSKRELQVMLRGAREEPDSAAGLSLDRLLSNSSIANDESDFGMGLELGLNVLAFDPRMSMLAVNLLTMAYNLLDRAAFSTITTVHIGSSMRRRKDVSLLTNPECKIE